MLSKTLRIFLLITLVLCIPFDIGCHYLPESIAPPIVAVEPKIVLITLDGVRWQNIFNGTESLSARELLPNLYNIFVDQGMVVGRDSSFIATGPNHISQPGYLEIMRGYPSFDCQTNNCNATLDPTIVDLFEEPAVIASWDTICKTVGQKVDAIPANCGRSFRSAGWNRTALYDNKDFPEEHDSGYRPDEFTARAALEYLQYYGPQFIWISFGDTDEWAHAGDYNRYIEALKQNDRYVGLIFDRIQSGSGAQDFTFIVTGDHGRGNDWRHHGLDFESAKLWLMMSGRGVPKRGFVSYGETKSLSNVLPTVKELVTGIHNKDSLL